MFAVNVNGVIFPFKPKDCAIFENFNYESSKTQVLYW